MATVSSTVNKTVKKPGRKEKFLHIPKTLKEGWADVTRSTPSSPEARKSPLQTANELSRSVNFLLNIHEERVANGLRDDTGSSGSSIEDLSTPINVDGVANRKSSLPEPVHELVVDADESRPRRSSMSRIFDSRKLGNRSPHSSAGNLLTAVLSKTIRKKYVAFFSYVIVSFIF